VVNGESEDGDCDEVRQDNVNLEKSEQDKVDGMKEAADSRGKAMRIEKSGW